MGQASPSALGPVGGRGGVSAMQVKFHLSTDQRDLAIQADVQELQFTHSV